MSAALNNSQLGLLAGLLLAVAGVAGGFVGFVVALLLGAIGLLIGRYADGELDVAELAERTGLSDRGAERRRS
ncbi:hypothetical protein ACIGG9_26895 [Pseudonocardia alni]|jgi:uncharacterized membrane protein|uniref:hypothetical protein n=1 Tax=Pseudonocardia alni TaxID=33907 RepID=UPI0006CAF9C9|nr:hypothetical protein WY02_08380 [Pseudonocardia sp. AL041005-10]